MYKINLHAHTIFSDGDNTPLGMALKAKELGFSALVITDHFYPTHPREWCSTNIERRKLSSKACDEAERMCLPTISGIELAFGNEEMLVFGTEMIQAILRHCDRGNELSIGLLKKWRSRYYSAFILCHPQNRDNWIDLLPILDGYERYNSGQDMFCNNRDLGCLMYLPNWCNSDAHCARALDMGHNETDVKIETEEQLIAYIRSGKLPEHILCTI